MSGRQRRSRLERAGQRGRYVMPMPGSEPAELTFVETEPDHMPIDYSWVPPQHRGSGVALKLVRRAVEDARAGVSGSRRSAAMSPPSSGTIPNGPTCWKALRASAYLTAAAWPAFTFIGTEDF